MARKTADQIRIEIRDKMVEAIKKGTPPWRQPWIASPNAGWPRNFQSQRRYTGINPLILMLHSEAYGYQSAFWGTSASWLKTTGGHVKKGEHAVYVTLFKHIPKRDKTTGVVETTGTGKDKTIPIMREFPVFNVSQLQAPEVAVLLDGRGKFGIVKALLGKEDAKERVAVTTKAELLAIAKKFLTAKQMPNKSATREEIAQAISAGINEGLGKYKVMEIVRNTEPDFEPAEALYKATKADIRHGGTKAFYRLKPGDYVNLPPKRNFDSMADYYQTGSHELVHWAVNGGRVENTGEKSYAFIELVAEIGACFVNMELGVPLADKMLDRSQSYVGEWLKQMGNDPKYIFHAATLASKAADYLLAFVGKANPAYVESTEDEAGETAEKAVA